MNLILMCNQIDQLALNANRNEEAERDMIYSIYGKVVDEL